MRTLEELKRKANKAYSDAVECRDHKTKAALMKKYYSFASQYREHKQWIQALES